MRFRPWGPRVFASTEGVRWSYALFGNVSTGAESDLKQATKLASKMVAHYGMSKRLGAVYFDHDAEHPFLGQRIATDGGASDATTHVIESEAREVLAQALEHASQLLEEHKSGLEALQSRLLEKETLEEDELQTLLGPPVTSRRAAVPQEPVHH